MRRVRMLVASVAGLTAASLLLACSMPAGTPNRTARNLGVPAPVVPAVPANTVLWTGDAETGDLSQYQDTPWNVVGGTAPRVVTSPVREGRYAVELSLPHASTPSDGICCGSRDELVPKFRDFAPGDDLYFGFSTYLKPGFPVDAYWQSITQFKQNFDGSPPVELDVGSGSYELVGGDGHPDNPKQFIKPLAPAVTGRWVDWVIHMKFSPDPAVGFVEVWKDGALVLPRFAPATGTMYPGPDGVDASYLKMGYYRDPTINRPGTIYFDRWRIGTSLSVVQG
jgi:hypothetical protein